MQPELPWNVAGIPPEAREAARAAARREGLSVGEWLTRRILKSFGDLGSETAAETGRESWRSSTAPYRVATVDTPATQSQDSEDMLARVSRAETETQGAYRRIEDQMRAMTRRLDATERSQSENGRAMSKAAAEINVAAREQAQAFDQLGGHVVGLTERLARVERSAANEGVKDAVKALHQGLSRLADQISETANQSATQIASLAGNVESVAGRLNEARGEAEQTSRSLESRIAAIDERVRAVERAAHASASALEKTIASIEATHSAKAGELGEIQRQATALAQINDTIDKLGARMSASEAQSSGAMARLEESVAKLELRNAEAGLDRRLQGIEHTLTDIADRLEHTEQKSVGADFVEENLRNLATRVDAADKRHRDALAELRAAVKEANGTLEPEPTPVLAPIVPPAPLQAAAALSAAQSPPPFAGPNFDLPPFPDHQAQPPFAQATDAFTPPPFDPAPAYDASTGGARAFGADAFVASTAHAATSETFLAAARRSAREAAAAQAEQTSKSPFAGFSWGFSGNKPAAVQPEKKSGATRFLLIGGIALIVLIAMVAGVMLSHGLTGSTPHAPANLPPIFQSRPGATPTATSTPDAQTPPATQYVPPADDESGTPADTTARIAPSSPKVKPQAMVTPPPSATKPVTATQLPPPRPVTPMQQLAAQANIGNPKAELLLGLDYLDGQGTAVNEAEAARWLERAASQGNALAQYRLGTLYERGRGVPADGTKAIQLYGAAAKLGNLKAMHNLAVAYAEGTNVKKDPAQAALWFTRAANFGLADSEFNLAVLYERGLGVPQSLADAYKWYAIAAAQGDTDSKVRIDALGTQLSADDKAAASKAAASFKPQAVDRAANTPPDLSTVLGG
jgi:localization factor PodJL